jgi:hypothetical protein
VCAPCQIIIPKRSGRTALPCAATRHVRLRSRGVSLPGLALHLVSSFFNHLRTLTLYNPFTLIFLRKTPGIWGPRVHGKCSLGSLLHLIEGKEVGLP